VPAGLLCEDVTAPPLTVVVVVRTALPVRAAEELPDTRLCDEEAGLTMAVDPAWEEEPETAVALAVGLTTVLCDDERAPPLTVAVVVCEALSSPEAAEELPAAVP